MRNPEKDGYYLCWIDIDFPEEVPPAWVILCWKQSDWFHDHVEPYANQPYPAEWVQHWQELPPKPAHL